MSSEANKGTVRLGIFVVMHIAMLVSSLSGVLAKFAAFQPMFSLSFFLFYGGELALIFLYAIVWQQVLKRLPLTVAYSNRPVSLAWGLIWGQLFFHESITWNKLLGAAVIFVGIYLMVSKDE